MRNNMDNNKTNTVLNDIMDINVMINGRAKCDHVMHSIHSIQCDSCKLDEYYSCNNCPLMGNQLYNGLKRIYSIHGQRSSI